MENNALSQAQSPDVIKALGGLLHQPAGIALAVAILIFGLFSWKDTSPLRSISLMMFGLLIVVLGIIAQEDQDYLEFSRLHDSQIALKAKLDGMLPDATNLLRATQEASTQAGYAASNSSPNQGAQCSSIAVRSQTIGTNAIPIAQRIIDGIDNSSKNIDLWQPTRLLPSFEQILKLVGIR